MSNKLTGFFSGFIRSGVNELPLPPTDNPPPVDPGPIYNPDPQPGGSFQGLMLFSGLNYTGDSILVTDSVPVLSILGFADRIKSMKYNKIPKALINGVEPVYQFSLHTITHYGGRKTKFLPGLYPDIRLNQGDYITNSIKYSLEDDNQYDPPVYGGGGGCFTFDTLITMADGSKKKICEVVRGDEVASLYIPSFTRSENMDDIFAWWSSNINGAVVQKAVVDECVGRPFHSYYSFNDGKLKVTYEHPLLVLQGNRWSFKRAELINVGDKLKTSNGFLVIKNKNLVVEDGSYWNMSINGSNLYYANDCVAHNIRIDIVSPDGPILNQK